jgi:DNA ligase D-like protein (predicted 3'-phosphoesterase)
MSEESLKLYREKRNFTITPEPSPAASEQEKASVKHIFVIQKHDARNLHYDFRLEVNGVLKSWAVPKGPSTDPKVRRLAIMTEDHPLDYAQFEGLIPEGQYGAGTVIVWDIGYYRNTTEKDGQAISMGKALEEGHATIWLEGKKIKGGYALTRTQRGWILVKMKDSEANSRDILEAKPGSALSNRTIEEMAGESNSSKGQMKNS